MRDNITSTTDSTNIAFYEERPDLARLVTPSEAKTLPVYNWFVYPHSFSPSLVKELIRLFHLQPGDRIYDPFVGAGTTLLAAKESSLSAVGLDLLPVSTALASAKVARYNVLLLEADIRAVEQFIINCSPTELLKAEQVLMKMVKAKNSILFKAFDEPTIAQIIKIKAAIAAGASNPQNFNFLLLGLLALLEEFSATAKSGGWLKVVLSKEQADNLVPTYKLRLNKMLREIVEFQKKAYQGEWMVKLGDAREFQSDIGLFNAIISSPPYLNRHDYTRVLALELLIGFLEEYKQITDLRYNLLRSHVEAKPKLSPIGYKPPLKVVEILAELKRRGAEQRVLYIVSGYFEDMYAVLKASRLLLVKNGYLAFVLGNVRFSGLPIPVDEIVSELATSAGFSWEKTLVARRRNNSAQQMRDFGRDPSRESVIICQAK